MADDAKIWKSLGRVWVSPPLEAFYALDSVRGDRPAHEETQIRGRASQLLDTLYEEGATWSLDMNFVGATDDGVEEVLWFQPFPTEGVAQADGVTCLVPHNYAKRNAPLAFN